MDAIYARQSLEKQDSVSIETQINFCKALCKGDYKVYKDAGYSGATTDRPEFQLLIEDIKMHKISRVIAYRLDRISRSITDFAKLIELFQSYNVEFISATEQFDTSSPVGRAMVYIIMVFAQLERETIASRIRDNYFSRAEIGVFLGGNIPYGYKNIRTCINGKNVPILDVEPETSKIVTEIFDRYTKKHESMHSIAMSFPGKWTAQKVRRILKNPVYTACEPIIYEYFKNKGYNVINPIDDFNGKFGCWLIGKEKGKKNRIMTDIKEQNLIIGLHKPLVDAQTFIDAQNLISKNKSRKRAGTSEYSWLTGFLKCSECGYAITIKHCKNKDKDYFYLICRGRSNVSNVCSNSNAYNLYEVEKEVEKRILNKIQNFDYQNVKIKEENNFEANNKIKAEIIKIDEKINNLIEQMATGVVSEYINKKIVELDSIKKELQKKIIPIVQNSQLQKILDLKNSITATWKKASMKQKRSIAELVISRINISRTSELYIEWRV